MLLDVLGGWWFHCWWMQDLLDILLKLRDEFHYCLFCGVQVSLIVLLMIFITDVLLGFQIWNTSLSSHHTCPDCICINLLFVSVWIIWSTIIQLPWNWWRWPLEHSNTGCQMPVCSAHKMGVELAPSRSLLHNPFILAKVSFFCVLQWCFLESAGAKSRKASNPNYWITHIVIQN